MPVVISDLAVMIRAPSTAEAMLARGQVRTTRRGEPVESGLVLPAPYRTRRTNSSEGSDHAIDVSQGAPGQAFKTACRAPAALLDRGFVGTVPNNPWHAHRRLNFPIVPRPSAWYVRPSQETRHESQPTPGFYAY